MDTPLLALTRRRLRSAASQPWALADTENMRQLIQLRWLAVGGQFLTILAVAYGLGVPLPVGPMLGVIAAAVLVNLVSRPLLRDRRVRQVELLLALLFDVGALGLQLYLSGGATNPFVALFLLQVVLGAILLEWWATWVIVAVTGMSYAVLAARYVPLRFPPELVPDERVLMIVASWLCFALIAVLLVLFVTRIIHNLRVRDTRLADLRQQAAEEDHLVRMGLFASGAAHELGTPLATLAVILGDWRRMPRLAGDPELRGEIAEMQAEVQRCKTIVTDVLHSVAELPERAPPPMVVHDFLAEMVSDWRAVQPSVVLDYSDEIDTVFVIAADPALRQAIWNLLDNAAEVSPGHVTLTARVEEEALMLTVRDTGPGFSPALLADFGRPGQSHKGAGHGVGLFLVARVARQLGGTVLPANVEGGGAEVTIALPLAEIRVVETFDG